MRLRFVDFLDHLTARAQPSLDPKVKWSVWRQAIVHGDFGLQTRHRPEAISRHCPVFVQPWLGIPPGSNLAGQVDDPTIWESQVAPIANDFWIGQRIVVSHIRHSDAEATSVSVVPHYERYPGKSRAIDDFNPYIRAAASIR